MATSGSTRTTLISPFQYFADPTRARPIFNGFIFIGRVDGDPTNTADQIPVQVIRESGGPVTVAQPIRTGPGGLPIYNGSPAQIVVCRSNYSLTLQDNNRVQVYHSPNVQSGIVNQPITHTTLAAAMADDNSSRQLIRLLGRGGAEFRRAANQAEYDRFPDISKFTDAANVQWVLYSGDGRISIFNFGVVADNSTVNRLSEIGDYLNVTRHTLTGSNTPSTTIVFNDTISITDSKWVSETGLFLRYTGGNIDYRPVISIGNEGLEAFSPSRFSISNWDSFRINEVINFSSGGIGLVLFKQNGFVYFHFFSNGNNSFPSNGNTVTGVESTATGSIANSRSVIFPDNARNAGIKNIHLECPLDLVGGIPQSHIQATAYQFNGVSQGGIANGLIGTISARGFINGVFGHGCYSLVIDGPWQFDRCGNGILQGPECWTSSNFPQVSFGSIGTAYDSIERTVWMNNFTYGTTVGILNSAIRHGIAPLLCEGTKNMSILGGDVEFCFVSPSTVLNSKLFVAATDKTTADAIDLKVRGFEYAGVRTVESFGISILNGVDTVDIHNIVHDFTGSDIPSPTWRTMIDVLNADNATGIRIKGIQSDTVDFSDGISSGFTLSSDITFTNDCYANRDFTFNVFSPMNRNFTDVYDGYISSRSIELISFSSSCDTASPPNALINLSDRTSSTTNDITIIYDSTGIFSTESFTNRFINTDALRFRLRNLRVDIDSYYSISCRYRYLSI